MVFAIIVALLPIFVILISVTSYLPTDLVLLAVMLLVLLAVGYFKHRRAISDAVAADQLLISDTEAEEIALCPGCFADIAEHDYFCPHCRYPTGAYAAIDPIQRYWAIAYMVSRGIRRPPLNALIGAVFIFFLLGRAFSGASLLFVPGSLGPQAIYITFAVNIFAVVAGVSVFLLYMRAILQTLRNRSAETYDQEEVDDS
ncbi:MAG: hypothetical protein RLZZ303_2107 [Candidatus Hydrogenedentota bacterium]